MYTIHKLDNLIVALGQLLNGILTIYTNGLISGFPEIGALVPINLYNLIVRIRHPALHGAIYLHQKNGFASHPVKGRCHLKQ